MRLQRNVAAYGVKFAFQIVDAPAVKGKRHDAVLSVQLGDRWRHGAWIGGRADRRNQTELRPCGVGSTILLATFLNIAWKPTERSYMEHAGTVLPDDHQRTQITGGAEIEPGIDASADGNVRLAGAGRPGVSINEPRFCSDALVQDQIAEAVLPCGHALRLLGQALDVRERAKIT